MLLKIFNDEEFELDVNHIKTIIKNIFNLPDSTIEVELYAIQDWLEKRPPKKRWKKTGVKRGILNWFKKNYSNTSNSHKISRRETNRGKVVGKYSGEPVRSLEAKYGSVLVMKERMRELREKLDLMSEIADKSMELYENNPLLREDVELLREELLDLFPNHKELVNKRMGCFTDLDTCFDSYWGEYDKLEGELYELEEYFLQQRGKNER